ncbi:formin-like protein [Encephalitozoon romaleae SJ-2008]|uniref:Formin-like protein n=1 Tax=Encephalitozoon romaleae (strain SJ-2008) TaxID=1178016 RepID=I7APX5_ENCRO|nr:formin-like protein [Encephalitozoon romaleae SJ-2008]AFN83929.1 formin-like protein [Encephalitozoon romaleae SJ-2008]
MERETLVSGARINTGILEKIQALVRNSEGGDFRCVDSIKPSSKPEGEAKEKEVGGSGIGANLNVWRINHRVLVFGQCWENSTENITRRNNTKELIKFFNDNYKDRFMIWCTGENLKEYVNVQRIPSLEFDLGLAYRVSCAVRCWLEFNSNNIAALEVRSGDEDKLRFLVGCILRHCGVADRTEIVWERYFEDALAPSLSNINTVKRYIKYFDSASALKGDRIHSVVLKQLIVTTIPLGPAEDFTVGMKVMRKGEELSVIREQDGNDKVYRDEDYVVFSGVDCEISEDIQILMCYYFGGTEKNVVLLRINTLFYRQGLYRFVLDDMECFLSKKKFDKEFTIDIVMIESGKPVEKPLCMYKTDIVQGLRLLNENFWGEPDRAIYERLTSEGRNEIIAKFCAFMKYCPEKAREFIEGLEVQGLKTSSFEAKVLRHMDETFKEKECSPSKETKPEAANGSKKSISNGMVFDRRTLYSMESGQLKPLELIVLSPGIEKTVNLKTKKIILKKKPAEKYDMPAVIIKKPLHWIPLARAEKTIFDDVDGINADIDYKRFEEIFCEPFSEHESKSKQIQKSIVEDGRLFLVSLSLKHLEMRNITPENVYSILKSPDNALELQDLLNIEKMYPDHEEVMNLISAAPGSLSKVEKAMLAYSQLLDVRKLIEILIFERKLFDEIFLIEGTLSRLLEVCSKILDSKSLRVVLKMILEIGNTMNFRYSMNKKKASGFRLSSLYVFSNYRGKNNTSLFPFLFQMLEANGVRPEYLLEELSPIHDLKNEELTRMREKINYFIEMYTEKLELLDLLEESVKEEYAKFFRFACSKLESVSCNFKKFHLYSSMIKCKFGEEEARNLKEILVTLSDFLCSMKQHLEQYRRIHNQTS